MRYPLYNNWLQTQKIKGMDLVIVRDFGKDTLSFVSQQDIEYSKRIDGHNPYKVFRNNTRKEVDRYLGYLYEVGLIRKKHFIRTGLLSANITLFTLKQKISQVLCKKYASILHFVFAPIFILGWLFLIGDIYMRGVPHIKELIWNMGIASGLIIGICVHELSHGIFAWAYGAEVLEVGIMLAPIPGAYVLIDDEMTNTKHKIRILSAGIEANMVIFGVSMIILFASNLPIFAVIGLINMWLSVENMFFIPGLDGYEIIRHILRSKKRLTVKRTGEV